MTGKSLKICVASSELTPLAKTGGLADVASALSVFLDGQGHDIRVLIPFYSKIDKNGLEVTPVDFMQDIPLQLGPHQLRLPRSRARSG